MWDKEHETDALRDYEKSMKSVIPQHRNWFLQKSGLLIDCDPPGKAHQQRKTNNPDFSVYADKRRIQREK